MVVAARCKKAWENVLAEHNEIEIELTRGRKSILYITDQWQLSNMLVVFHVVVRDLVRQVLPHRYDVEAASDELPTIYCMVLLR